MDALGHNSLVDEGLESVRLVDHHCHSVFTHALDRQAFELVLTESRSVVPGSTNFDTQLGYALLRWCSPMLGLDAHVTAEAYLDRRGSLGVERLNQLFLGSSGVGSYLLDTGFPSGQVLGLGAIASASNASCHEIARLEVVAEEVVATGTGPDKFVEVFRTALAERLAAPPRAAALLDLLADRAPAADGELPDTGVGLPEERRLSPAFILGTEYGTRSTTALVLGTDGHGAVIERSYAADGSPSGTRRFRLSRRAPPDAG